MQYLESTGREIKDEYLLWITITNHAIQFKAIRDFKTNKEGPSGLPKLGKSTDVLGWLDRVDKTLRKLTGQNHTPLAYLVRGYTVVPAPLDDLIPGKCYSLTHKSLIEELVNRKSYLSLCVEADKVTLYDHLDKALSGGPLESVLQAHEDTKDGQAVMESIIKQHGGKTKWEKSHATLLIASKRSWKSTGNITLTEHIASYRSIVSKITKACKHTAYTPPTSREQVLTLLGSIETTDSLLQAHIAQINGDPNGKGSNFEETATHLMLADPVEKERTSKNTGKKGAHISAALAGRGPSTNVDLRWYPNDEYQKLSTDQKTELLKWRKTPAGESAALKAREERDERRKAHHKRNSNANKQSPNAAKRQRKWDTALTTQVAAAVALYDKEQTANAQLAAVIQGITKDKAVVSAANPKPENDNVDTDAIRKTKVASIISRVSKKKVQFKN